MYIVVQHDISNPATFFEAAQAGMADLPSHLILHHVLPSEDGSNASCLWEASSVEEVQDFMEPAVGAVSNNTYFAVEIENAVGLPTAAKA